MATTKIWAVHTRLDKVIDYATDEEKTILKTIKADEGLELVYKYATNSKKTEEQFFVTGVNCIPEIALDEMRITKRFYAKNEKIVGFHAYQSFAKGEVQPELAHKIGVRLAEEMWGDRFQVVVTTHLNTNCIHNHFVLNSISFRDGKSYYDNRENYALLRETSDLLCGEYGLSVIQEKSCPKSKINYSNYLKNKYQNSNYYITTKEDIDRAIAQAYSYKDFENILKSMKYTLTYRADKLSVCRVGYKRNIRVPRAYGSEYTVDRITERIQEEKATRVPFQELYARKRYTCKKSYKIIKRMDKKFHSSLYRLYLYYRYKLNSYRKTEYRKPLTEEQRKAIKQMDKYSNEAKFLCRNNINSTEELFSYKKLLNTEILDIESKIRSLNKKIRNADKSEIQYLTNLKNDLYAKKVFLKKEVELCEGIEQRIPIIKEELKENEFEKERDINEHIR